jgi:hypothetical protein
MTVLVSMSSHECHALVEHSRNETGFFEPRREDDLDIWYVVVNPDRVDGAEPSTSLLLQDLSDERIAESK